MLRHAVSSMCSLAVAVTLVATFATGCNSGSSTVPQSGAGNAVTPTPAPLPASATASVPLGTGATASLGPVFGGYSSSVTMPAASNTGALTLTFSAMQPAATPAVQSLERRPQAIGGTAITPVAFLTMTSTVTVTFEATPAITFTLPPGAASLGQISYVALYETGANPQSGWTTFEGPERCTEMRSRSPDRARTFS